jgi:hypothetical protein
MSCHADRQPCPQVTRELMPAMRTGILAELPRVCRQKANKRQIVNAVEIEEAISDLAEQPFDPAAFPYAFLEGFREQTDDDQAPAQRCVEQVRSGRRSADQQHPHQDLPGGRGQQTTLAALKASPATTKAKAKFILATDGKDFQAEDLTSGETSFAPTPTSLITFGFFLPLAGISTVKQIRESAFDIKATGRLNRLYVELAERTTPTGALPSAATT